MFLIDWMLWPFRAHRRSNATFPNPEGGPFGKWLGSRPFLVIFLFILTASIIAETGENGIQHMSFFWMVGAIIAFFHYVPRGKQYPTTNLGMWMRKHPIITHWIIWFLVAIVFPILVWNRLRFVHKGLFRPLMEGIAGGNQTYFLIAICVISGVPALVFSWPKPREKNVGPRRKPWPKDVEGLDLRLVHQQIPEPVISDPKKTMKPGSEGTKTA